MTAAERDAVALHAWFVLAAVVALAVPFAISPGWRMAVLVGAYVASVVTVAVRRRPEWRPALELVVPLSALLLVPSLVLSGELEALVFARDGFPDLGAVSWYVPGVWLLPLFVTVFTAESVEARQGRTLGYATAFGMSVTLFALLEVAMWAVPVWRAGHVVTLGRVALFALPAELLLGMATYAAHVHITGRHRWLRLPIAGLLMLLYLGAAVCAWFLLERLPGLV